MLCHTLSMLMATDDKTNVCIQRKEKNAIAQSIYFLSPTIWFYEADYGDGEKVCEKGKGKFHYLYISYIFLLLIFSQDRLMILFNEISNCCVFASLPVYFNLPVYYRWSFLPTSPFIAPSPFIILAEFCQPPRLFCPPFLFETRKYKLKVSTIRYLLVQIKHKIHRQRLLELVFLT